jgi:hypothetical protein
MYVEGPISKFARGQGLKYDYDMLQAKTRLKSLLFVLLIMRDLGLKVIVLMMLQAILAQDDGRGWARSSPEHERVTAERV